MSKQEQYISDFNTILRELMTCIEKYQEDPSTFIMYKGLVDGYIQISPDGPISHFILHIYRNDAYRNSIINNDEEIFFLKKDYTNVIKSRENIVDKIFMLQNIWDKMDDATKKYIRRCLQTLVKIGSKYILTL